MKPLLSTTAGAIGFAALLLAHAALSEPDRATWLSRKDPRMPPAIAQARETLPQFWAKVDTPKSAISEAAVKAGFPTQHGGVEFLWLEVERHGSATVFGRIVNEPEDAPSVHAGQEISVPNTRIIDWTYNKGGQYFGQFTTRVLLKTASEARRREENLAPTPLEPRSQ